MDSLKRLLAFARVVEHGSFSAAARAMNTTQSNVSKQVAALERELGSALVERSARPQLTPTPAGAEFLPHARTALDALQRGRERLGRQREQVVGGGLGVGVDQRGGEFRRHPAVRVEVH